MTANTTTNTTTKRSGILLRAASASVSTFVRFVPLAACLTLMLTLTLPTARVLGTDPPESPTAPPAPAPHLDPTAMAILKKVEKAMIAPQTYQAECDTIFTADAAPAETAGGKPKQPVSQYQIATLTAQKPNLMRYDAWYATKDAQGKWTKQRPTPSYTFVSDGKTKWKQYGATYRTDQDTTPENMATINEPWGGFYSAKNTPYQEVMDQSTRGEILEVRGDGAEAVGGVACDKVFVHKTIGTQDVQTTWYIGRQDGFVRREAGHITFDGKNGVLIDATLRNIKTNFPVANPETLFAYTPPKDVKSE